MKTSQPTNDMQKNLSIHKYELTQEVEMPTGATIIKTAIDPKNQKLWIWALVNPKAKKEKRYFISVKTGADLPDCLADAIHLETVGTYDPTRQKMLWYHVWELPAFVAKKMKVI